MKRNIASLLFAFVFLAIALSRWSATEAIDRTFYLVAVAGFVVIWIASNLRKGKKKD
jgi:hypothetical protein